MADKDKIAINVYSGEACTGPSRLLAGSDHGAQCSSHRRSINRHRSAVVLLLLALVVLGALCVKDTLKINAQSRTIRKGSEQESVSASTVGKKKASNNAVCARQAQDPDCIRTPQEYVDLLKVRSRGSKALERTACVADNLLGRMYTGAGKPDDWQLDPVLSNNPARRIIFAIGPRMLEKILVYGRNAADKTVKVLGYGDSFVCGTAPDYNSTCQYRLLIWQSQCQPKNYGPLVRGDWANLEDFMREDYGGDLPSLKNQIQELEDKTFQELTACNPDTLVERPFDAAIQAKSNCSSDYMAALAKFPFAKCNDSSPTYSPYTKCPAEEALLKGQAPPTTLELRAFLQQTQGFLPQYTGYSYTANMYSDPLTQEYWVHNTQTTNLANSAVVKMYNDTANAL